MKIACTIEARMRSTRLPNKVMLPILQKPMLELMIERLRRVPEIDEIVIATTTDSSCEPIVELGSRLGVTVFRGSEKDVLDRVLKAAQAVSADLIVETTGDCPLIDPATISRVIRALREGPYDYCSNRQTRTFPVGMDVQVFPTRVLADVASRTDDPADHEHVSLYIYEHPGRYRLKYVESGLPPNDSDLRLTVDTPEDFALIRAIYEALYPTKPNFDLRDVLRFLHARPDLVALNHHIQQKPVR